MPGRKVTHFRILLRGQADGQLKKMIEFLSTGRHENKCMLCCLSPINCF